MRILLLSAHYPPEMGAGSARISALAGQWARSGAEVQVITGFAQYPSGSKRPGDRFRIFRRERVEGVDVFRVFTLSAPHGNHLRRLLSQWTYVVFSVLVGLFVARRPHVVVATSPHLFCAWAGHLVARLRRSPFVFEVRDLWPESVEAVGASKPGVALRWLQRLALRLYHSCDLLVTVGPGYRRRIEESYGIDPDKIVVFPNGFDEEFLDPNDDVTAELEEEWRGRFVVLYAGVLGLAQGLMTIVDAATELAVESPEVLFAIVGEGAERTDLERAVAVRELTNVRFYGARPRDQIAGFYRAADLGCVPLRRAPLFETVLPSKMFESMATATPVLLGVAGDAERLLDAADAGWSFPPGDGEALADLVRRVLAEVELLKEKGRNGRRYVRQHYDRERIGAGYLERLRLLVRQSLTAKGDSA